MELNGGGRMNKPKMLIALGALPLLVLSACGDNESEETAAEVDGTDEPVEEVETDIEDDVDDELESDDENDNADEEVEEEPEDLEPQYTWNQEAGVFESIGDAQSEAVLLTIDDAPDNHAVEMAEILHNLDVSAIFFVNGHFLTTEEQEEELLQIIDYGHAIGNHTMGHPDLQTLSEEEQYEEIVGLNDVIEDISGERPDFFRAPFGLNTDYTRELAKDEEMLLMNWTYGYDWESDYLEAEPLADVMVNTELLRNGANLLMHDREWTKDALEDIVLGIEEKGYRFIHPDEIALEDE